MAHQRLPRFLAIARHHIEDALGKARFGQELANLRALREDRSAGFSTAVQPAASAGAKERIAMPRENSRARYGR